MTDPSLPAPRSSSPITFPVAAWRQPVRAKLGMFLVCLVVSPAPVAWAAFPLMKLGVPARPAMIAGALVYLAILAWAANAEFRPRPAGALSLEGGRLRFDAWSREAVDVPLSDVRKAVVYRAVAPAFLRISLRGRRPIFVHEARLGGVSLEEVAGAVCRAMDADRRTEVESASAAASRRIQRWVRFGAVAGVAAAVIALVRLLLLSRMG